MAEYSVDLLNFLSYGAITDYPVSHEESKQHFDDKISIRKKLEKKLTDSAIFNVICTHQSCTKSNIFRFIKSRFNERMSFEDWLNNHHSIKHENSPKMFIVASFWSTMFDGYGYDTEYRLISLTDNKPLKPLNEIYSDRKTSNIHRCGYCHVENTKLRRCGGCKILFYCNDQCQKKHWQLIHKQDCKKWKKKYKNKMLNEQEINDLDTKSTLKLSKMAMNFYGDKVEMFKEMMHERTKCSEKEKEKELLLFPEAINNGDNNCILMNTMMSSIINAFDRDGDKKLNFKEWKSMWNVLGFRNIRNLMSFGFISWYDLFYRICEDIGLIPDYEPSLNNGVYGSYFYPEFDAKNKILFGPQEILETLKFCAYFKSVSDDNMDDDFMEKFDYFDEKTALQKAFTLLWKLAGHAQTIITSDIIQRDEVQAVILKTVPCLGKDTVTVIHDYMFGERHIINISWHRIEWFNVKEDQEGLWNLYDQSRNNQYYDLFYLNKQDDKGYEDTTISIQICEDIKKCGKTIDLLNEGDSMWFSMMDTFERKYPTQKWCLGQCPSYIPEYSFNLKEYALLIGNVLEYHHLNHKLCHYIYIGVGVNHSKEDKKKIVDAFNAIYGSQTKYRPHAEKKASIFHNFN